MTTENKAQTMEQWLTAFVKAQYKAWGIEGADDPTYCSHQPWEAPIQYQAGNNWLPLKKAADIKKAARGRL